MIAFKSVPTSKLQFAHVQPLPIYVHVCISAMSAGYSKITESTQNLDESNGKANFQSNGKKKFDPVINELASIKLVSFSCTQLDLVRNKKNQISYLEPF